MDNNNYNNPYTQPGGKQYYSNPQPAFKNPGATMATVSLVLGIGSIFTLLTVYFPLILGSLAIVFAVLSTGYGKKMLASAKVGIGTAIGGIVLVITIIGSVLGLIFSLSGDDMIQFGQEMDKQFEEQMGISLEEFAGESYEDVMKTYVDLLGK